MRLHQTAAPLAKVWAPKAAVLLSGHNETGFQRRFLASSKDRATDWQCRQRRSTGRSRAVGRSADNHFLLAGWAAGKLAELG